MPQIQKIKPVFEKKIDLTPFFKEEAFITIVRMNKYAFTFLTNRNRAGYHAKIFENTLMIIQERDDYDPSAKIADIMITPEEHRKVRAMFTPEEAQKAIEIEDEVNAAFFMHSIHSTKHNFTGEDGNIVELDGSDFYRTYGETADEKGVTLADYVLRQIMEFNYEDVKLGE
jgi:hypothetical protein